MKTILALLFVCFLFFYGSVIFAAEKLVLMGGGVYESGAVKQFVEWAGNENASILILPWATGAPNQEFEEMKKVFAPFKPAQMEEGIGPAETTFDKAKFLTQLDKATGIFFPGGDQVVLLKHLNQDAEISDRMKAMYRSGIVFGGYSAGTAIMSEVMLTGNGDFTVIDPTKVETVKGFGLVNNFVVDQHFIARQRQNRLLSVLQQSSETLALGIDEGTALLVEGRENARVVGNSYVTLLRKKQGNESFELKLLPAGTTLNIREYKQNAIPEFGIK